MGPSSWAYEMCRLCPLHAHCGGRINSARRHARTGPARAGPPAPADAPSRSYAPSTCAGGWSSSAYSPVTRYTTRFATDTAWSANRS